MVGLLVIFGETKAMLNNFYVYIINKFWSGFFNHAALDVLEKRKRWTIDALMRIPSGKTILDAGAGTGMFKSFCNHLKYISQDLAEYDGSGDGLGFQSGNWVNLKHDIVSDISSIPRPDNSFDVILCTEVLEHVVEPVKAIVEFSRLLRSDGILILTVPFCCIAHQTPYFYSSGYSKYYYQSVLPDNGFDIIELTSLGNYFDKFIESFSLTYQEVKRSCKTNVIERILYLFFSSILLILLKKWVIKGDQSVDVLTQGICIVAKKKGL